MAAGWSNLVDLEARLERIQNLRPTPDFEPLAASFKRIRNILEQAEVHGRRRTYRREPARSRARNRNCTRSTGASPGSRSKP